MHIKSQCLLGRTCYWHERRVVPAPLGGLRKRHACKLAATAAQLSIRQFSRNQDPVAAAACEETLTQALANSGDATFFCASPDQAVPRWQAISRNTLLTNPTHPILHALGDPRAGPPPSVGISYFYPEEHVDFDYEGPLPEGWRDWESSLRPEARQAQEEVLGVLSGGKAKYYDEVGPFLYIAFMGTLPSCQGQGLGGQMLKHLTAKADAAGKPMYIEASSEDSARLYERHGFVRRSAHTWSLPDVPGSPTFTLLTLGRAARPVSRQ